MPMQGLDPARSIRSLALRGYMSSHNLNSVKLTKVNLKTGRKGFYFLSAKAFNSLPPPPKLGA